MKPEKLLRAFLIAAIFFVFIIIEWRFYMSESYAGLAENYFLKSDYKNSFETAKDALQFNAHNAKAYAIMARLNLRLFKRTDKEKYFHTAFVAIRNATESSPYNAFYYDFAGKVYLSKKNYNEAIRMYKIAINLYPEYIYFQNQIALIYHETGDNDKAVSILNREYGLYKAYIYAAHPDGVDIFSSLFLKTCIFFTTAKQKKALNTLRQILKFTHDGVSLNNPVRRDKRIVTISDIRAVALYDIGTIYKRSDNRFKSEQYLRKSFNLLPQLKNVNQFLKLFSVCK